MPDAILPTTYLLLLFDHFHGTIYLKSYARINNEFELLNSVSLFWNILFNKRRVMKPLNCDVTSVMSRSKVCRILTGSNRSNVNIPFLILFENNYVNSHSFCFWWYIFFVVLLFFRGEMKMRMREGQRRQRRQRHTQSPQKRIEPCTLHL
jgi:hypothetical protein